MSCFVCRPKIYKSVAKVCFQYGIRQEKRSCYPLTLKEVNDYVYGVAKLNNENVAVRYDEEEMEVEVEYFDDIPLDAITAQDVKNCDCWMYQTCDYRDDDEIYLAVAEATKWAKAVSGYSKQEYEEAEWG